MDADTLIKALELATQDTDCTKCPIKTTCKGDDCEKLPNYYICKIMDDYDKKVKGDK